VSYLLDELSGYQSSYSYENGFRASRRFRVSWADHINFMTDMVGSQFPGFNAVRCTDCSVEPQTDLINGAVTDPSTDLPVFDDCIVVANYQSIQTPQEMEPPAQVAQSNEDGTFFTYRQSMSAEFLTLPGRTLKWEDNNKLLPPDAQAGVLIPKTEHNITWHKVSSPNWSLLASLRGRMNESSVTLPVVSLSCSPETLLLEGVETDIQITGAGVGLWQVSVKLTEKRIQSAGAEDYGHNHALRDDPAGWVKPKGNNGYLYKRGDFSGLFVQV